LILNKKLLYLLSDKFVIKRVVIYPKRLVRIIGIVNMRELSQKKYYIMTSFILFRCIIQL
jgi:hypothetical protein